MLDAIVHRDVRAACVSSTAKAWFSALAQWEAVWPVTGAGIASAFLAEATLKVGRRDQAVAYASLIPSPMRGLASIAELTRAIEATAVGAGGFEAALHRWAEGSQQATREAPLRLAQAAYGLGEYELALAIAARELAIDGDRFKALAESSQRGIERCRRLDGHAVIALPHPIIRDLRAMFPQDDATGLAALTALAVEWSVLANDGTDLIVMLRRGMLAGDTGIFASVSPRFEAHLAPFVTSRQFLAVAGDEFRDFANACVSRRRLAAVAPVARLARR